MDPRDLKAASKYINNLLASRGLLRGKEIPFYKPADDDGTPAKIINLIHELLSRRDKEAEQQESLALTLRTLRTTETKQTETIETLKSKNADLTRQNALLESASRSFAHTLRTAEAAAKTLRDETTRIKTLLSQVRTQCANDIRKRDVQIQKMKERLSDTRSRGTRAPMAQCTVIGAPPNLANSRGSAAGGQEEQGDNLAADTADFLTKLSQGLADENDNLIALVRTTLSTLKAIQGLPDDDHFLPDDEHGGDTENPVVAPPASFEDLTAELDQVMYSLKEVLNQPNYVPLEDLAERDAEIQRLVTKNATLEEEWKKAIDLVDEWNKTLSKNFAQVTEVGEQVRRSPKKGGVGRTLVDIVTAEEGGEVPRKSPGKRERKRKEREEVEGEEGEGEGREEGSIVEPVQEALKEVVEQEAPARSDRKRNARKDDTNTAEQGSSTEPVSKPRETPTKKDGKRRATKIDFEIPESALQEEEPIRKTPAKKDKKRRVTKVNFEIPESPEEPAPEVEPKDRRRKAPETNTDAATLEETIEEVPKRRPRASRAKKDDVEMVADLDLFLSKAIQDDRPVAEEAPKPRERRRRARKDDETMAENTAEIMIQAEETAREEAPKARERRRRVRKGDDDTMSEDTTETTIYVEETVSDEAPKGKEKRRRARKGDDETMAEDTMGQTIKVIEVVSEVQLEKTPKKRRASRAKKPTEDSMLDELAAEPVPVHYEEIANEIRVIGMNDEDAAGAKPNRARRRSSRNRDKYPASSSKLQEASPAMPVSVPKRKRKSTAGSTPRKRLSTRGLDGSADAV